MSLVATLTAGPALAQKEGPTDPNEPEAFLDELMAVPMEEHHITGASSGIGKSLASHLVDRGAPVMSELAGLAVAALQEEGQPGQRQADCDRRLAANGEKK